MNLRRLLSFIVIIALFGPGQVCAQNQEVSSRFEQNFEQVHDRGIYLRLGLGVAYGHSVITPPRAGDDEKRTGAISSLDLGVGLYPTDGLVLGISAFGELGINRGFISAGPGVTFYFNEMNNWHVSAMLGLSSVYDEAPDIRLFEQLSLAGQIQFGTGWWVSPDASMGLALCLGGHHLDLDGDGILSAGWVAGLKMTWAIH